MALEWISVDLCLFNYHNLDDSSAALELVYKLPRCVFRERSQLNGFTEYSCSLCHKKNQKINTLPLPLHYLGCINWSLFPLPTSFVWVVDYSGSF